MQSSTAAIVDFERPRLIHSRPVREPDGWRDQHFNDIGELCRFLSAEIFASKMKFSKIGQLANCHPTTVAHLARNETASPRASTVFQVLRALGFEVIVRG